MDDSLHAARLGDFILHPPLAAELVSGLVEAAVYAAAAVAVGAAIGGAVVAVVGTGGTAAFLTPLVAGVIVSAAASLPTGEDKSIGDHISDFSNWVGNSMFPPEKHGEITSGSHDTFINGTAAARAAGVPGAPDAQSEQAEEPSILENIGSYAMLAVGMMPLVGLAQDIDSIFNPPVTTPKASGSVDALEDTVTCDKHPPEPGQFVAQGSDKVFINGQPAARVGDKTTCDAPIGMQFSPNVRIGGGTVTVRDIHDGKSAAAKIIGLVAGMLIARRGMLKRGMKCGVANPVAPSTGSKFQEGPEDIDFSLPALVPISWARRYDSSDKRTDGLFGMGWSVPYEVRLERIEHPQGGELWIYVDDQGSRLELGRLQVGSAFVSILDGLAFFHQDNGCTIVEDLNSGLYQVFHTDPLDTRRSRLVKIGDRNLNCLELHYDQFGRLQFLGDTYARTFIELRYASQQPRRVVEVHRLHLGQGQAFVVEQRQCLVRYQYTSTGQLETVVDAEGQRSRHFAYTNQGLLASHTLAAGATRHYEWASFTPVRPPEQPRNHDGTPSRMPALLEPGPDHEWRVVRHWGSDGEDYRFCYDLENGHTQVTDGLGRVEHYHWGGLFEVHTYIDAAGQCWRHDHVDGLLRRSIDPQGGEWSYGYDALGRQVSACDPLGRCESYAYTEHWVLPTRITDSAGRVSRFSYDRRGNLLNETDPLGQVTRYGHDRLGRLERIVDAQGKEQAFRWNERGQLIASRDCSGHQTSYRYDLYGHLSEQRNAAGVITRYRFDARGHLLGRELADGRVERYQINASGQLTCHVDPAQQATQWQYDDSGRLVQRTDAMGLTLRLGWDAYGRLLWLENENGERYRFQWDALDRLSAQRNLDGGGFSLSHDALGNVLQRTLNPSGEAQSAASGAPAQPEVAAQVQRFQYDLVGRLLLKQTDDGETSYRYDDGDNLLSICFKSLAGHTRQLDFTYDAMGRLTSECQGNQKLGYSFDPLGNLQTLTLPDQRRINFLHYGSGRLHQINLDGRVISDFERDELHAEVMRTQGALQTRTRHDRTHRVVQRALEYRDRPQAVLPLLQKDYQYDASDNLIAEVLTQTQRCGSGVGLELENIIGRFQAGAAGQGSFQGRTSYGYGPTERICVASRQMPHHRAPQAEQFAYDPAGNMANGLASGRVVRNDQVTEFQGRRYRYDRFGRLAEKRSGTRLVQHFEYDAEHRLVRVRQQRGPLRERIEFGYDPLGRRTEKRVYRGDHAEPVSRTAFLWQGVRLLQEIQDNKPSLYLYPHEASHEPLARVDGLTGHEQVLYFHTNLAGLPEQLTDEQGMSVWQGEFQVWGNTREEWHSPVQASQQNLRFQGQYLDRETGLHYNTFRYYDPDIGRFTQQDPIGLKGGTNLYRYAPNPMGWVDALGLSCDQLKWGNPKSRPTYGHTFLDHGQKLKANQLIDRARGKGHQVGQYLDDNAAAGFVADVAKKGPGVHDMPLPSHIKGRGYLPDGTEIVPDMARVVVKPDGSVRTSFPFNSSHAN
ncbi:RHS domain-containing protein [Pseudomonas xanthosomatis]|uniref:RHS repeat-associated core domain-containing protein n=1 Tax=Pseudomonas xanthosomatis TaxID=2842356 RepID=UPI001C3E4DDF|nr:RHS repeat-associated core domain-containing protein [Pseudomonas xanthosomatis]QXH45336.1 RHS domain-containing protein [Pseudomonas xanthosomatis]